MEHKKKGASSPSALERYVGAMRPVRSAPLLNTLAIGNEMAKQKAARQQ